MIALTPGAFSPLSQSLADGLKRNLVLKKLDLCENRIDLEGAMALAEIFRLNNGSFSIVARLDCSSLMVTTSFVSSCRTDPREAGRQRPH